MLDFYFVSRNHYKSKANLYLLATPQQLITIKIMSFSSDFFEQNFVAIRLPYFLLFHIFILQYINYIITIYIILYGLPPTYTNKFCNWLITTMEYNKTEEYNF
jgi:hypothetical protein